MRYISSDSFNFVEGDLLKNYAYPLNEDWSSQEIATVVAFLAKVEAAYETQARVKDFKAAYRDFKQIVTSIAEEKQLDKQFGKVSGYSIYQCVKKMKELADDAVLKMP